MSNLKRVSIYIMNITDLVALVLAFLIAYAIRSALPIKLITHERDINTIFPYTPLLLATIVAYVITSFLFLYAEEYLSRSTAQEVLAVLKMIFCVVVIDVLILFFTKTSEIYSRIFFAIFLVVAYFLDLLLRETVKNWFIPRYKKGKNSERMVIVTASANVERTLNLLNARMDWRFHVVGLILTDVDREGEYIQQIPVICHSRDAFAKLKSEELDSILLADAKELDANAWISYFQPLGKSVHVQIPEFYLNRTRRMQDMVGDCAVVSYLPNIPMRGRGLFIKRGLDVILSIALLPFVVGISLLVIVLNLLTSRGPLIEYRVRVGQNGRRFENFRFRILRLDAEDRMTAGKGMYSIAGRLLKATHLDGLPQVLNVLVGDMSFVGPQAPSLPEFVANPEILRYLCARPGIIGRWSCDKHASAAENEEYLNRWRLLLDFKIVFVMILRYVTFHSARVYPEAWLCEERQLIAEYHEFQKPLQYDHNRYQLRQTPGYLLFQGIKRLVDIVGSLVGIVVLSPVFLILMIMVMGDDGGNPFYGHRRVGKNGKRITVYKFRSMRRDAGDLKKLLTPEQLEQYQREFKIDNDPRITNVGNFIRKTSLDELPQLFNILKGDLSIVGPRPITEKETEIYGPDIAKLLSAKPGLTGYWQAYARNNATYESGERQKMEMYYVEHQSLWLDLKILFRTVKSVSKQDGAQ